MLPLAADENFNSDILRGLLRRRPEVDVVRVQDVGLGGASDPEALRWAAREGRVLLTYDQATMTRHALRFVEDGQPMAGVFQVPRRLTIAEVIDELLLIVECSGPEDWRGIVIYLPL